MKSENCRILNQEVYLVSDFCWVAEIVFRMVETRRKVLEKNGNLRKDQFKNIIKSVAVNGGWGKQINLSQIHKSPLNQQRDLFIWFRTVDSWFENLCNGIVRENIGAEKPASFLKVSLQHSSTSLLNGIEMEIIQQLAWQDNYIYWLHMIKLALKNIH